MQGQFSHVIGMPMHGAEGQPPDGGSVAAAAIASGQNPLALAALQQQQQHAVGVPASMPNMPNFCLHGAYMGHMGPAMGSYFGPMPGSSWSGHHMMGMPGIPMAGSLAVNPAPSK